MASKAPHLEAFLDAARYFIGIQEINGSNTFASGSKGAEMASLAGFGQGFAWCAAFISACAQKAGIANVLISKQTAAGWLQEATVLYCGGTWIDGPYNNGGVAVTPMPGDIISFANSSYYGRGHATHVGIVEYVEDGQVHTIEGNTNDECARRSYALDCSRINEYVRPDWESVGDDITSYLIAAGLGYNAGPLYPNRNDRHDMTLREVGYFDSSYNMTNKPTGIRLSIINYTITLGNLYDMFAPASQYEITVDTSKLTGNVKIVVDYLIKMGFSASAASGVTAALKVYSNLNPRASTSAGTSGKPLYLFGLCGWSGTKLKEMEASVGVNWNTNLTGQLQYMLEDLSINYKGLLAVTKNSDLDVSSAKQCAHTFLISYNSYFNTIKNITAVKEYADEIFSAIIITKKYITGNIANLKDADGNTLSAQYSVSIPSSVPQTGIVDDYTSYSHFYHRWARGTTQRKLANLWYDYGCTCDKGVATIGGYYCVAVRPKFGKCGDVIVITLEDNTIIPAIICDEKGEDAGSEWGHVKGGGNISIVEWERVVTYDGKVQTEGTSAALVDGLGFSDWLRKKVSSITNYGSYL